MSVRHTWWTFSLALNCEYVEIVYVVWLNSSRHCMGPNLLVFICWSLDARASVGVHFPAWLTQAVLITRGCVPCAFNCFICWWGQRCCWNVGVNVLKQMLLHPSVRRPFAALIAYFSLSASTSPTQVFVSILFLLPHQVMKHDLIVLDTNPIQEDCSPSFYHTSWGRQSGGDVGEVGFRELKDHGWGGNSCQAVQSTGEDTG